MASALHDPHASLHLEELQFSVQRSQSYRYPLLGSDGCSVFRLSPYPGFAELLESIGIFLSHSPPYLCERNSLYNIRPPLSRSEEHTSELESRENLVCR